jgi:hypothetical protein
MKSMAQELKIKEMSDHLELSKEEIRQMERVSDGSVKAGVPKIPPFDETKDDIDSFLRRFERYALSMKWDKSMWATHLSALLKGRALDVFFFNARSPSKELC